MFCEIIYVHILVHIYVLYDILNNIFTHLSRISRNIMRSYQLLTLISTIVYPLLS
jgi:hypothetical protein